MCSSAWPARPELDALRARLHHGHLIGLAGLNRPDFRAHRQGRIAWAAAGHPARLARLSTTLRAITGES